MRVPETHPTDRRWLALWLVLAAIVTVRATTRLEHRGVLLDHLEFGRRLLHGADVYGDWRSDPDAPIRPLHAPYPPSFGLLTAPFALLGDALSLRAARLSWALLQVLAVVAIALALRRVTVPRAPPDERLRRWLWLAALLLSARFLLRDLHGGGGNVINVALCLSAFACAERRQAAASGWLLGFSLLTKPTQVWLLPVFWLCGHRRATLHTVVAGAALVLASLWLLRFDTTAWQRWLTGSWALATNGDPFAPPALDFPEFTWMNQSLRCAAARWLGTVPDPFAAQVTTAFVPGLGLDLGVAVAIGRALALAALAWLLVAAHRHRGDAGARTTVFAAALALSVLLSPLSWKAHHVALLPLLFLLLVRARACRSRALTALLLAFALGCAIGGDVLDSLHDGLSETWNSLYVLTGFDLLLFAVLLAGGAPAVVVARDQRAE